MIKGDNIISCEDKLQTAVPGRISSQNSQRVLDWFDNDCRKHAQRDPRPEGLPGWSEMAMHIIPWPVSSFHQCSECGL